MAGYKPVFKSILQSTIWECQPHVKVVWLSMLLMCDRNGIVEGSVPGLARAAVVTREQCDEALRVLMAPDPDSRTPDNEGRRVEVIDGGWRLLNHAAYQLKLGLISASSRERVARYREKKRLVTLHVTDGNHLYLNQDLEQNQEEEKKTEKKTEKRPAPKSPKQKPEVLLPSDWEPSAAHVKLASENGIDLALEVVKFKGYADGRKAISWNGKFSTWLGNAIGFARERNSGSKPAHKPPQPNAKINRPVIPGL